ncbi:MAG: DNA/RNA nuclease SfsA [Vicinamibacterales bacterium]|nr:DNA/RNA nuclease SfsA [Vicinamibacterales bacterium]
MTLIVPEDWVPIAAPRLGSSSRVIRGRFVARPHRFAARVDIGSAIVEAHLANPGRLTGVLAPGCDVALEGPFAPPRVLPYTMLAARAGRVWAGTVTTYANRIFPLLLQAGVFPELSHAAGVLGPAEGEVEARTIRREVVHGRSRFDFEVEGRLVEVKSVSLAEGHAGLFPDAVTARGARHCDELADLARRGRPTAIVFVAQRADIESVAAAETIDPGFARSLRAAAQAGVTVLACALRITPRGATAARRVPVLI